jgi:hypothetical protein
MGDASLVVNTDAGVNLRSLALLTQVNTAGSGDTLRRGILLPLHDLDVRESAAVKTHAKGTGAGYLVDLVAGYAVGDTLIHVDTGTGTILPGDVVTFAGDTNNYIVASGYAGDGDGDITLAAPGLRKTLADGVAMTIGDAYVANMAFDRSAVGLMMRPPARPEDGDLAVDLLALPDPNSGLVFEFAFYRGYGMVRYQVQAAWGVDVFKPEHTAILLG